MMAKTRTIAPLWSAVTIVCSLHLLANGQSSTYPTAESPCPSLFEYEPPGSETDRWYGLLKLNSDVTLHGIWVDIVLDKKADLLGNWFGEVTSKDNTEFKIENKNEILRAGTTTSVRFFVKSGLSIPRVKLLRLNGRQICSIGNGYNGYKPQPRNSIASSTSQPPLTTSSKKETTPSRENVLSLTNWSDDEETGSYQGFSKGSIREDVVTSYIEPLSSYEPSNSYRPSISYKPSNSNEPSNPYGSYTSSNKPSSNQEFYSTSYNKTSNSYEPSNLYGSVHGGSISTKIEEVVHTSYVEPLNSYKPSNSYQPSNSFKPSNSNELSNSYGSYPNSSKPSSTQEVLSTSNNKPSNSYGSYPSSSKPSSTQAVLSSSNNRPSNLHGSHTGSSIPQTVTSTSNHRPSSIFEVTYSSPSSVGAHGPQENWSHYDDDNDKKGISAEEDYFLGDLHPQSSYNKPEECGKVAPHSITLITSGTVTSEGQYPWHIAIYRQKYVDSTYICGGNLVSKEYVITAAHCVTRSSTKRPINPNILTLHLGKYNLRISVKGVQLKFVSQIIVHPDYATAKAGKDIAILKMRSPVELTDHVRPICLWPDNLADLSYVVDKTGAVVGWGFDENGRITEDLRLAQMPVIDEVKCIRSYGEFYAKYTTDTTFCAGYLNGTSVCNGDSGGGMVFPLGDAINPTWHLRGLVSISAALLNKGRCDPSHYIIFTDVAKFNPWIKSVIHSPK